MIGAAAMAVTACAEDFVVTAGSGESCTNTTDFASATRLVKRGVGEVVLNASSSFAGSVVIEEGTLTIAHKSAVGSSAPIEVQSGATLWLKIAGLGQSSTPAFPNEVTIAGKGVGNNGALRFTNTGSSNGDSLLPKLILSDDATIEVTSRWGMYGNKIVELNGHTLTRIGSTTGNWMMYGIIQSTGGPGEVNNVYGTLTFQNSPVIGENVTVVVTNISDSSVIGLWGASMGGSKGTIKVYNGRNIQAQSGNAQTSNHIGPLHLAGNTASAGLYLQKDGNARAMSVDGAVTCDSGVGLAIDGKGSLWLNNDVTIDSNIFTSGGGSIYFCGENSVRNMKLAMKGNTTTTHEAGKTYLRMLRVANGSDQRAQFRQTGGVIGVGSGDNPRIGETVNQRSYYTLEGGEFHASNTVYIAEKPTSFGAFRQTGGFFESYLSGSRSSDAIRLFIGRGGNALFVQTGGTSDIAHSGSKGDQNFRTVMGSTNGVAEVTISGVGTEFRTCGLHMGTHTAPTTNILNLANGGKLKVNRFRKNPQVVAGSLSVVNADGGILAPTFSWNITGGASNSNPNHFVVWENGFVVDTTENAINNASGTGDSDLPFIFEKPTGKGVESITLPDLTGTNYIGIGRIVIEDATGWGASAYAEFDFTTKKLTHVVVTSRGCGYSDNAKAYLESPAGTSRYECALTLSDNAGRCGKIVKRGTPTLVLSSTSSTIDGGYVVEEGMLRVASVSDSAIPVRVEAGATLNFSNKSPTFSTVEGAGTVTNGTFTVTDVIKATCADLFAGRHAIFTSNLTLGNGVVFEITDAENLDAYKDAKRAVALETKGSTNLTLPQLRLTTSTGTAYAGTVPWSLRVAVDGKTLKFGADKGLVISFR